MSTSDSERRKRRPFEGLERKLIYLRDDVDFKINNRVERNEGQKLLAYSDGYDGGCYTVTYVVVASRRTRTGTPRTDPGQPDDPDC